HMARCNCGHLVQTLTGMDDKQVSCAVDHQLSEWTEHAKLYCSDSGRSVDEVFKILDKIGFDRDDVMRLENLNDPQVLKFMGEHVYLERNVREDAIAYMRAMADMLEMQRLGRVSFVIDGVPA
ncbi:MAG: hypothetical protein AAF226_02385, partial [Verrucomicrobiota bacterium]